MKKSHIESGVHMGAPFFTTYRERGEKTGHVDNILYHLIYQFKNEQAARHLLDEIEHIYNRLEENPLQFPVCRDTYQQKDENPLHLRDTAGLIFLFYVVSA